MTEEIHYKSAASRWFHQIPDDWHISKLKFLVNIFTGNSLNDGEKLRFSFDENPELKGYNYISSKDIDVGTRMCNYDTGIIIPTSETKYKVAPSNSTLLCIEGGSAGKKITFTTEDVCFVNKLACFKSTETTHSKFVYYFLQSNEFKNQFQSSLSGLIGGVSLTNLNDFEIPVPPLSEQQKIADFLDRKTTQNDTIIEKKQKLLQLLEEKKKSVINEAVTKGLNPNVPMKDSGIEWIGDIPESWEVSKLGYLGSFQNGVSKGGDYFGTGYPFVNYGDIYKNFSLPLKVEALANSTEEDRISYSVEKGDVFFTRTSETIEEIGIASTCLETIPNAVFSGFTIRFRPDLNSSLFEGFSKYFFRSNYVRISFTKEMNLVTRASLSQTLLKSLTIFLPSLEEQKSIAKYLDNYEKKFFEVSQKLNFQIEKLKEYRQSIISEAVTGKIAVSN
ncbi:hypothetical protein CO230_03835 [Chryseobacterium sp. 6424]|uniref:restriction endonuclease subunit S n=1 Tax=Chryseobacterium sp. 6424 TaxID=2039166 RepID=UPI000EFADCC4|nr:restriction endonuclease subunit S [Chryseobacterium sp. 6424]AYO57328.1 hypothetical protein CO230_03835 [Chryseobacterium sp. 6424]